MNKDEIINKLKTLIFDFDNKQRLEKELVTINKELEDAKNSKGSKLLEFDKENMEKYILSKVGQKPIEPKGLINLFSPSKKKEYEEARSKYLDSVKKAEADYYVAYKDQRIQIENNENNSINELQIRIDKINQQIKDINTGIITCDILPEGFKDADKVCLIYTYFKQMRVDSIKEAINLYYEEQHRERLETIALEQIEQIKKTQEIANDALLKAEEALNKANVAIDDSNMALNEANSALSTAQQAHNEVIMLM